MTTLPHAHGGPPLRARLRSSPEDFAVDEIQEITPDGDGEHAWLLVRKCGANTDWVAKGLARFAGVAPMDVSYAGLKDRHAVTTQAFTVYLPGRASPDWSALGLEGVEVVAHSRHRRKLKRGALAGNRFRITLREVQGDFQRAGEVLQQVAARGVPNYFGEQRFGFGGGNVERAQRMFGGQRVDRQTRSLLLSAARSQLFNAVLARRVEGDCWDRALPGELWSLAGSRSWFGPEAPSDALAARLAAGDIHPSGPLWGRGELASRDEARALEESALAAFETLRIGLEHAGLEQERRALRLLPQSLHWEWTGDAILALEFSLPPGSYATVVLRELADWSAGA
jgi:tRNA pseudouridine13 synthase